MKKILFLLWLALMSLTVAAQKVVVKGAVVGATDGEPVEFATAALLQNNKVVVSATTSDSGRFQLEAIPGNYSLRVSYIGYKTHTQRVTLTKGKDTLSVNEIRLDGTAATLGTAVVTAAATKVQQVGDTTQFNAEAYRTPEGSTLESLVKQLPGVQIDDNGGITVNGKTVSKFLVNGKDFFKGDTKVAMKNMPTDLISKVKAYEKQSDYTERTGIDDGEEEMVLDFSTKRALDESWVTNADLGVGNHSRYTGRVFVSRFTGNSSLSVYAQANNVGDQGYGGFRGFGGMQGLTATKGAGLNYTWENGKKRNEAGRFAYQVDARYDWRDNDVLNRTSAEYFLEAGNTFQNSWAKNRSKSSSFNASAHLDWAPDTLTWMTFRPEFSHSSGHGTSQRLSTTYNADPLDVSEANEDSLYADQGLATLDAITVNRNMNYSNTASNSNSASASLMLVRRLNANGRNVSFRGSIGTSKSRSEEYSFSNINYLQRGTADLTHQYSFAPEKSWNYSLRAGYAEPIWKKLFAEVNYQYSYRYNEGDRSLYDLDLYNAYQDFNRFGTLPTTDDSLQAVRDDMNSSYAQYRYYQHRISLGVRYNTENVRFNAGVDLNPQRTVLDYNRPAQVDTTVTRDLFYVSPNVRFRYQFTKNSRLNIQYRGRASQPSMTNLLDVVNTANPLNISMGNPNLKPSWNNSFRVEYENFWQEHQRNLSTSLNFEQTSNSVSNRILYDRQTGVRYSRPDNIDGNWNARAHLMFATALDAKKMFNLMSFSMVRYQNAISYISSTQDAISVTSLSAQDLASLFSAYDATKNTTRTWMFITAPTLTYRAEWYDVSLTGSLRYQHARATLLPSANLDTWNFSYGASTNINLPWNMSFSTDIRMNSRRGYSSSSMNTNELLWNAQLSQSFLKGAATVSLQFYDILRQQSNISRSLDATMRSDSWSNAINSYFMVHFIYKLNIFGGKSGERAKESGNQYRGFGRPPGGGSGRPGGGGFGGRR